MRIILRETIDRGTIAVVMDRHAVERKPIMEPEDASAVATVIGFVFLYVATVGVLINFALDSGFIK